MRVTGYRSLILLGHRLCGVKDWCQRSCRVNDKGSKRHARGVMGHEGPEVIRGQKSEESGIRGREGSWVMRGQMSRTVRGHEGSEVTGEGSNVKHDQRP